MLRNIGALYSPRSHHACMTRFSKSPFSLQQIEWKEWISSAIFLPICLYFLANRGEYTLLDNANLIIHEAGHFVFAFFGKFIRFAGGTIMQILLPLILVYHFYVHDYRLGVQVFLFWLGHNLINISVYAADARARQLPLLGGDFVQHDWWTMLSMLDLLAYDQMISDLFFGAAVLVFLAVLVTPKFMMS